MMHHALPGPHRCACVLLFISLCATLTLVNVACYGGSCGPFSPYGYDADDVRARIASWENQERRFSAPHPEGGRIELRVRLASLERDEDASRGYYDHGTINLSAPIPFEIIAPVMACEEPDTLRAVEVSGSYEVYYTAEGHTEAMFLEGGSFRGEYAAQGVDAIEETFLRSDDLPRYGDDMTPQRFILVSRTGKTDDLELRQLNLLGYVPTQTSDET